MANVFLTWLLTWPIAMLLCAMDATDDPTLRVFPQLTLRRRPVTQMLPVPLSDALQRLRTSKTRLAALLIGVVLFGLTIYLPPTSATATAIESGLAATAVVGMALALAFAFAFAFRPQTQLMSQMSLFRSKSDASSADPLDVFRNRLSYDLAAGLLRLTKAPPERILQARPGLANLDGVLEFIKEMLPSKMTEAIRPRLWSLMEASMPEQVPGFYMMLKEIDKKRPGRLVTHANSSKDRKVLRDLRVRADNLEATSGR